MHTIIHQYQLAQLIYHFVKKKKIVDILSIHHGNGESSTDILNYGEKIQTHISLKSIDKVWSLVDDS